MRLKSEEGVVVGRLRRIERDGEEAELLHGGLKRLVQGPARSTVRRRPDVETEST